MKKRVADIIMDTLVEYGITDCFAVVGGGAMHLDHALLVCKAMKKYFNHHEQACAMAAEAYARYSGKMAAVCVTCGPGATNTLTGEICGVRAAVRVEAAIQRNTGVRNYSYGKKYDQICGHADGSACGKKRSGQGNSDRAGGKKRTGVAGYSTGYTKRYGGGTGIICLRRG